MGPPEPEELREILYSTTGATTHSAAPSFRVAGAPEAIERLRRWFAK